MKLKRAKEVVEKRADCVTLLRDGMSIIVEGRILTNFNGALYYIMAYGTARCNPTDTYDANLGIRIATGRAKANLAKQLVELSPALELK